LEVVTMAVSQWVYDKATGRFLYGGYYDPAFDPSVQGLAAFVDRHPDPTSERFDAASLTLRRPATVAELAADAAATLAGQADADVSVKRVVTTIAWLLKRTLGRNPTGAEVQTAVAEWKHVYQALP
jgi:hypothetical protein